MNYYRLKAWNLLHIKMSTSVHISCHLCTCGSMPVRSDECKWYRHVKKDMPLELWWNRVCVENTITMISTEDSKTSLCAKNMHCYLLKIAKHVVKIQSTEDSNIWVCDEDVLLSTEDSNISLCSEYYIAIYWR